MDLYESHRVINAVIQCDGGVTKWVTSIQEGYDPEHGLPKKGMFQLGRS